jgi:hypothetical protein
MARRIEALERRIETLGAQLRGLRARGVGERQVEAALPGPPPEDVAEFRALYEAMKREEREWGVAELARDLLLEAAPEIDDERLDATLEEIVAARAAATEMQRAADRTGRPLEDDDLWSLRRDIERAVDRVVDGRESEATARRIAGALLPAPAVDEAPTPMQDGLPVGLE